MNVYVPAAPPGGPLLCSVLLALSGHSNPALGPRHKWFVLLAQQTPGATLEPLFLAECRFSVCANWHWPRTGPAGKGASDIELVATRPRSLAVPTKQPLIFDDSSLPVSLRLKYFITSCC